VRRMCEAIGHPVRALRRVRIGPLEDRRLKAGEWRELTADEVQALRAVVVARAPQPRGKREGRRDKRARAG
jgi:16S rRNA U516 pseudouridylate synthase RsuA-like enzyme